METPIEQDSITRTIPQISKPSKIGGNKFDVLKFILSLMIFFLHSGRFSHHYIPLFRVAVPLFFITTSYFLFSKIRQASNEKERDQALKKFLKRNFYLLVFWTIVFIVPNAMHRQWLSQPFPYSLLSFLKSFIFGSTFMASWFLSASIIATSILYWAIYKVRLSQWIIVGISLLLNLFCCRTSLYLFVIPPGNMLSSFLDTFPHFIGIPYQCFPVAFIWIIIGKIIAYEEFNFSKLQLILMSIVGLLLVFLEYFLVSSFFKIDNNDCLVTLLLFCPSFFLLLVKIGDLDIQCARTLRKLSIIIFCTHGTFLWLYRDSEYKFSMTLISSILLGLIIIHLSKRFEILRYSH